MQRQIIRPPALVPDGFVVESTICDDQAVVITVRHVSKVSACPRCGRTSARVHSWYRRRLLDLRIGGKPVRLMLVARRFHCDAVLCGQRIFAERFEKDVLAPWTGRTGRLG